MGADIFAGPSPFPPPYSTNKNQRCTAIAFVGIAHDELYRKLIRNTKQEGFREESLQEKKTQFLPINIRYLQ
jgi:hypothetical protein